MQEGERRRRRKWLTLGGAGFASGIAMLLFFRSLKLASGTAVAVMIAIIVLKHVGLLLAVSSPVAALFQSVKPKLRAWCGRPPQDED